MMTQASLELAAVIELTCREARCHLKTAIPTYLDILSRYQIEVLSKLTGLCYVVP